MKILMGTKNPGKIEGARQAFEKYFDNSLGQNEINEWLNDLGYNI